MRPIVIRTRVPVKQADARAVSPQRELPDSSSIAPSQRLPDEPDDHADDHDGAGEPDERESEARKVRHGYTSGQNRVCRSIAMSHRAERLAPAQLSSAARTIRLATSAPAITRPTRARHSRRHRRCR